jgi:hypothetical protein
MCPIIGVDTESHGKAPFSIQVSLKEGTAILVLMEDPEAVRELRDQLQQYMDNGGILALHHAPADLPVLEAIGLERIRYRDTMQESYHLGLPQSLKVLGYVLFGVRMQSWEDLVYKYSREKLLERVSEMLVSAALLPDVKIQTTKKGVQKRVEAPTKTYKTLERIFKHAVKSDTYDIESRLQMMDIELDLPEKGIGHVPIEEARDYACRDADITLRLALELDQIRQELGSFGVREEDHDHA